MRLIKSGDTKRTSNQQRVGRGAQVSRPCLMDREFLQLAAEAVAARLPDNWVFILLASPLDPVPEEQKRTVYISNMTREVAINVLKEWLIQASGPEEWMQHIK